MEIFQEFTFEAAHRLPRVPAGHKCARLHGHSFRVRLTVAGPLEAASGWVLDFADVTAAVAPLVEMLDHHYLNEIPGLENPTAEVITRFIWRRLRGALPGLSEVRLWETCTAGCAYHGEDEGGT